MTKRKIVSKLASGGKTGLTAKQNHFVQEYLVDKNATQAAIRAGYSKKNADKIGPELLGKTRVAAAIEKALQEQAERTKITADRVINELALLGFANMLDYMRVSADGDAYLDFSTLTREQAAALAEITVEEYTQGRGKKAHDVKRVRCKLVDKVTPLVTLAKHFNLFPAKKHEHTGAKGAPIPVCEITPDMPPKVAWQKYKELLRVGT